MDEPVYFENWRELGCQVVVNGKEVLTLQTPESSLEADGGVVLAEEWVTPEEFCENLRAVLSAFRASQAMLERVEGERQIYCANPLTVPVRRQADLLDEVETVTKANRLPASAFNP